jgi:AcrR family transcriptional regulator
MMTMTMPAGLLAAAERLVEAHGPEGFTMDDLARQAGMSRATLYRRAKNREAVLEALRVSGVPIAPKSDTRARILQTARLVFGREGFEGATIEAIADAAGVGLATVYRLFGDKDGVVAAFVDEMAPRRTAREFRATGDLRTDLEQFATRLLEGARDDAPLVRLMFIETLRGSEYLAKVRALSPMRTLGSIVRLLQPHADAGRFASDDVVSLAQAFGSLVMSFGLVGPVVRGTPAPPTVETARFITELFLSGALAPKKTKKVRR